MWRADSHTQGCLSDVHETVILSQQPLTCLAVHMSSMTHLQPHLLQNGVSQGLKTFSNSFLKSNEEQKNFLWSIPEPLKSQWTVLSRNYRSLLATFEVWLVNEPINARVTLIIRGTMESPIALWGPAELELIFDLEASHLYLSGNRSCRHLSAFSDVRPPGSAFMRMFVSSFHPTAKSYEQNWVVINASGCGAALRPKLPLRVLKGIIEKKINK